MAAGTNRAAGQLELKDIESSLDTFFVNTIIPEFEGVRARVTGIQSNQKKTIKRVEKLASENVHLKA